MLDYASTNQYHLSFALLWSDGKIRSVVTLFPVTNPDKVFKIVLPAVILVRILRVSASINSGRPSPLRKTDESVPKSPGIIE